MKSTMYLPRGCCLRNLNPPIRFARRISHIRFSASVALLRISRARPLYKGSRRISTMIRPAQSSANSLYTGSANLRPSPRPSPLRGEGEPRAVGEGDLADFYDYRFAFSYAAAQGGQAVVRARVARCFAAPAQLVHQGHDHPRRGGAGRVTKGDRAAVDVRPGADLLRFLRVPAGHDQGRH